VTTCARITTTSAEVVVFCFFGGYDRVRETGKRDSESERCVCDITEGRRKTVKKRFASILAALCLIGLAGCAGEKKNVGMKENGVADAPAFASEDYHQGNTNILKTEKGYYYYSNSLGGFHYVDGTTGKDMYLCNKPECRHDGSEFCVATNNKYTIHRVGLYGGRIFATATEETDTQILYHLLSVALDGSGMNEFVTYLSLEKTDMMPVNILNGRELCIHRNVAMIPMRLIGKNEEYHGTAVVNLETKEVTYLDGEPVSNENIESTDISAHGDHFYYCRKEGKKTVLHRYSIKDGSDETYKLSIGFDGNYVVQDEDTVVYTRSNNQVLCVHHYKSGENEEKGNLTRKEIVYYDDGTSEEEDVVCEAVDLKTDGDCIYITERYEGNISRDEDYNVSDTWDEAYVHVFDRELAEIACLNMAEVMEFAEEVRSKDPEDFYVHYNRYMYFEDDVIYCVLPNENNKEEDYVYRCTKEEFLAGNPQFELLWIRRN